MTPLYLIAYYVNADSGESVNYAENCVGLQVFACKGVAAAADRIVRLIALRPSADAVA